MKLTELKKPREWKDLDLLRLYIFINTNNNKRDRIHMVNQMALVPLGDETFLHNPPSPHINSYLLIIKKKQARIN